MINNKKIGFIGAGNMAETLINGMLGSQQILAENVTCADIRPERLDELGAQYGIQTTNDSQKLIKQSDILIYAVKPQNMAEVLKQSIPVLDPTKLIISIAAGVPLAAIEAVIGSTHRLIRVMPNLCVAVKTGASAFVAGHRATAEDIDQTMAIFASVGRCVQVQEDYLMDAVTGLSGSGPAYVFLIAEALADGGVKMGLTRKDALDLAAQTLLGAARMLLETDRHPAGLKDMVTSPAGTTIAGLHVLEKNGLRGALIDAVEAATVRARDLGEMVIQKFETP